MYRAVCRLQSASVIASCGTLTPLLQSVIGLIREVLLQNKKEEDAAISMDKNGRILLKIHAKPNAKISRIIEITETEIEVAIAAPPHKGQANEALTDAIAEILGLRKNDVFFDTVGMLIVPSRLCY
uniref:DUF167 domain-containing protein n=1 Tax=Parascaris equorum TaxID=6256 RepID=A0A914RIG9_PAREQ